VALFLFGRDGGPLPGDGFSQGEGEKAPFGALEETAMEMTAEALSEQGGIGLWEVLYESLEDNAK